MSSGVAFGVVPNARSRDRMHPGRMNSHLRTTLLAVAGLLAATPVADAATFQQGQMRFTVSGSWVASGVASADCDDPVTGDRKVRFPAAERVTFKGTSAGRVGYRGLVGRSIFFERIGARPKVRITVTRSATPPAGCQLENRPDCGTRTLTGVANPEFEGPVRAGRPVKLRFDFARTATSYRLSDPFKGCPLPSAVQGWWAAAMSPVGDDFDFQAAALDLPSPKGLYARRSRTFSGSATRRYKGDSGAGEGPATATLKLKVGVSRKVTKSQPAFGS